MKIGILGGSFNPVHIAHMVIAEEASFMFRLDEMYLMPAFVAPHKQALGSNDAQTRMRLLNAAVQGSAIKVSDFELQRGAISYTVDTVRYFAKMYDVTLCIGADSAMQFDTWKDYKEILTTAQIAVYPRAGITSAQLREKWGDAFIYCEMPLLEISSSSIRERIKKGEPYKQLVPFAVAEMIEKERLYL